MESVRKKIKKIIKQKYLFDFFLIVNQLIHLKQIKAVFPLHDKIKLKKLESQWYKYKTKFNQSIPIGKRFSLLFNDLSNYFLDYKER